MKKLMAHFNKPKLKAKTTSSKKIKSAPKTTRQDNDVMDDNFAVKVSKKRAYLTKVNSVDVLCDRNYFKLFEFIAYGFVLLTCVLGVIIMLISTSRPDVKFFSVNAHGQVEQIESVGNDSSPLSNGSVQQFFLTAIPNSFTFDFNDYEYVFTTNLPKYFTSEAASEVIKYMQDHYMPDVLSQKQFFNVSVRSSFIIDRGFKGDQPTNEWRVQVPAVVNIFDGRTQKQTDVKFQFVVKYTGTDLNPYGLQISQIRLTNDWRY